MSQSHKFNVKGGLILRKYLNVPLCLAKRLLFCLLLSYWGQSDLIAQHLANIV